MNGDAGESRRRGTPQGPPVRDDLLADFVLGTLDEAEAAKVAAAVATDAAIARRVTGFRHALDALALDLDPAEPSTTGLDRLLQAAREEAPGEAGAALRQDATSAARGRGSESERGGEHVGEGVGGRERESERVGGREREPSRASTAAPRSGAHARSPSPAHLRAMRRGTRVVAGVLVVALVALVSAFATFQAASVAEVREEQRVLAYWMANPDMTLISLEAPTTTGAAASDPADAGHLGVVCLLPDGRGLVLRPYPAPRGSWYQVVGSGPEGELELARSGGNVLTFDARGIERLEVRVLDARRSGLAGVLDRVTSLLGGRPGASPDGLGDGLVVARVHLP